ncbi:T9SS type A sorting domain-containing protein [Limnovirga soli]|jgi:uncharacterized delta-60 repeat protein|uniref:T9SS type A sorting domain-containing protein n=1 Tax=Limnovirga soli TaxID=2656915 RepID=A0A8J8JVS6_9BACT|nr:T9SS type A sorting domain-containing protein [Limnovirga soli]NNV54591.1 T9SS type A sorting domain-containing protein [Limnovirga soli]
MRTFLLIAFANLTFFICYSQAGTLNENFGNKGTMVDNLYIGGCKSVISLKDGRFIGAGNGFLNNVGGFLIARYFENGVVDSSFGLKGKTLVDFRLGTESLVSAELQSNGKIVAAGSYSPTSITQIGLARLQVDGTIDSSFGINGMVTFHFGLASNKIFIRDVAIQADDKILLTGMSRKNDNDISTSFITRFLKDGAVDESFGDKGTIQTIFDDEIEIKAIAIQDDEKILLGGNSGYLSGLSQFLMIRYLQNGEIDKSFGIEGITKKGFDKMDSRMNDLIIDKTGKILTGGFTLNNEAKENITIVRFTNNGFIDNTFGENGIVVTNLENQSAISSFLIQNDGKIIGAGNYDLTSDSSKFLIVRYNDSGIIDSAFGENGFTYTAIEKSASCFDATLQANGKIILGGGILTILNETYFAFANYNGDDPEKNKYVRIKHWLHHHGITWEDKPNNLINYYSIQSSTNGKAFTEVARIYSNHNGGIQTYSAANNATANYRVAAVSNTGNITYSNTLSLVNTTPTIQLYPNPAKNNLQIQGLPAGTTKLRVTDITGNTRIIASANSTVYSINIAQLTSGNYLLNIKTANEVITKQFIKE